MASRSRALIDTSALLALSHARDQHHARAVEIARRHRAGGGTFIGTTLVLSELYCHLMYRRGATVARTALRRLLDDPIQDWREVGPALIDAAQGNWLAPFADQSISLVDAVSFEVMAREGIAAAFAFDHHFEVAGYALLGA